MSARWNEINLSDVCPGQQTWSTGTLRRAVAGAGAAALTLILMAVTGGCPDAQAFQIKRVVRQTCNVGSATELASAVMSNIGGATADANCNGVNDGASDNLLNGVGVDVDKTFVLFSRAQNETSPIIYQFMGILDDLQTVLFARNTSGTAADIDYMVAEFVDGVTVYSGMTTVAENRTQKDVKLPSPGVTLTKAFPLISVRSPGANTPASNDERTIFSAELTSATNLRLTRSETQNQYNTDVFYQVVAFDAADADANVQYGTATIAANSTNATVSLDTSGGCVSNPPTTVCDVNKAKSMLFFTAMPASAVSGNDERWATDGTITSDSQLTFTRQTTAASCTITVKWYLVEFTSDVLAQHDPRRAMAQSGLSTTWTSGSTPALATTKPERSLLTATTSGASGSTTGGADEIFVRATLNAAGTQVTLTRLSTGTNPGTVPSTSTEMVQLPPLRLTVPNGGELWRVGPAGSGNPYAIQWSYADDVSGHNMDILLSKDGGSTYPLTIASAVPVNCADTGGTAGVCGEGGDGGLASNNGQYRWAIPETLNPGTVSVIDNDLRIRLVDTNLGTASQCATNYNCDASNGNFEIKGTITVTSPNAFDVFPVQSTSKSIGWSYTGQLGNLDIHYLKGTATAPLCTDAGWTQQLTTSASYGSSGTGSWPWEDPGAGVGVNDDPFEYVWVRVRSDADPTGVCAVSPAYVAIRPSVTLERPATSASWPVGRCRTIQWAQTGTVGNVDIQIKVGGGAYTTVAGGGNVTPYTGTGSNGCEVGDITNPSPQACSAGPPARKCWDWNPIPFGTQQSNQVRIKVRRTGDDNVMDESPDPNNWFTVLSSIDIKEPNTGLEKWKVGSSQDIKFDIGAGSGVDKVHVYYTKNYSTTPTWVKLTPTGGMDVTACRANAYPDPNGCKFNWSSVDDAINADVRIKVTDFSNESNVYDITDASLSIIGGITVTAPTAGQIARIQQSPAFNITWTNSGDIFNGHCAGSNCLEVRLIDGAVNTLLAGPSLGTGQSATAGNKSYSWTPADNQALISTTAKIRVQAEGNLLVLGESPAFKIKANFTNLAPGNGSGQVLTAETLATITWDVKPTVLTGTVTLKYDTGALTFPNTISCVDTIGDATGPVEATDGRCDWPSGQTDFLTSTAKVKLVLDGDETDANAVSTYDFRMKGELAFTAGTVPTNNGADPRLTWLAGANPGPTLSWTRKGSALGNMRIAYSRDGGTDGYVNDVIASVASSPTSYMWVIPDDVNNGTGNPAKNDNIKIRIVSTTYSDVNATAAQPITVTGQFLNLSPNGAETWFAGDPGDAGVDDSNISWTTKGNVTPVDVLYTTDGSNWVSLPGGPFTNPSGLGGKIWNVDAPVSNTVKVRVRSANSPSDVYATSAGDFTVKGKVKLNSPTSANTGASALKVSNTHTITWACFGSGMGTLKFSFDGGSGFGAPFATGQTCASPQYDWNVPDSIGTTKKLKVECEENFPSTSNPKCDALIMASPFEIKGTLDVLENTTGPYSALSGNIPIQWKYTGTVGNIQLRYDDNDGKGANGTAGDSDDFPDTNIIATVAHNYGSCAEGATCTYNWPSPAMTGTKFRFRITPVTAANAAADSQTTSFSIKGTVSLSEPVASGGSSLVWQVGTNETIAWTSTGSLGNINIKYTKNNGVDNFGNLIATVPVTDGSYPWNNIPSAVLNGVDKHQQFKIKLEQAADTTVNSVTTNPFWVRSRFVSLVPNGGEPWKAGEARTITWTTQGVVSTVNVKYSVDGGSTWTGTIASAVANGDSQNWTVNCPVDEDIRVRVESADSTNTGAAASDVYVASASNIVVKARISITSPGASNVGASSLRVGDGHNITWTLDGSPGSVKLSYDNGAGTFATTIATGYDPTTLSFNPWTVPDQIPGGADNRVKIECEATYPVNGQPKCDSAETGLFEIKGRLNLTSPDGGEVFYVGGSNIPIQWNYRGTLNNIELRYDNNSGKGADNIAGNGDDYPTLIATIAHNYGSCAEGATCTYSAWAPPATAGTKYRVRLIQVSDTSIADSSNTDFPVKGNVVLVRPGKTPGSPEMWTVNGPSNTIEWTVTGGLPTVDIHLDTASGTGGYTTTVELGRTATASPFSWTIPSNIYSSVTSDTCRVRVRDSGDATVYAASTNDFKIKPVLQLQAPNNNTFQWVVGTSYNVTWDPAQQLGNIGSVKLNFSTNGGKGANGTAGDGDDWPDTDCVANLAACATNKGGLITASVAVAAGSKSWTVPDLMTNEGMVRMSKVGDAGAFDDSDSYFYIKGSISNVQIKNNAGDAAPSQPIDLPIDVDKYITWDTTGTLGTVDIKYATDANLGSPTWTTIPDPDGAGSRTSGAGVSAAAGSYQWRIPNAPSPNVAVKIFNVSNPGWQDVSGQSTGLNSIIGSILNVTVVADGNPTTTDMEVTGSKTVQWQPNGNITKFKVEYRTNGGTWTEITSAGGCNNTCFTTAGGSGEYRQWVWNSIPNAISNDVDFRVSDYDNPTKVSAESSVNYIIKGKLSIVSPISTDVWTLGATPTPSIRWSKQGTIGDIKIEYSTSGTFTGGDVSSGYVFLIADNYNSGTDGNNDYAWPAGVIGANRKISDTGAVRISNITAVTGTELVATSQAFKIRPSLTGVTAPNGSSLWNVGDTSRVITWACNSGTKGNGALPKVILEYNVDGGSYAAISGASSLDCTNGSNNYTWPSIPDERTDNATVRVSFVDYTSLNLVTPGFKIYPVISVSDPTSGQQLVVGSNYANLVKWTRTGTKTSSFEVRYSTDGTTFPNLLADNQTVTNGTTGVTWNIPAATTMTSAAKIRVTDKDFPSVVGDSAPFKLKGGLTLTGPTGSGTTLTAGGATNPISFTFSGAGMTAKAYYSLNSGGAWTAITTKALTGSSGADSINWDMSPTGTDTTTVTNTARVKVTNLADETDVLSEGADFGIGASFNITAPESGAVVIAEDSTNITWDPVAGTGVTDVKLEYTNNASAGTPTWTEIASGVVKPNTGSYTWASVPGTLSDLNNDNKVRITQKAPLNTSVQNMGSGTAFRIKAQLDVTVPGTGSESWDAGSTHTIKFKKKGAVQTVNLYYDHKNGNGEDNTPGNADDYATLITATPLDLTVMTPDGQGQYSYDWTIADTTPLTAGFSGKIKAKVVGPGTQNDVEDVQANSIEVKGAVTLLAPGGTADPGPGIITNVGGTYTIQWSKFGAVQFVDLHYSMNQGSTYPFLIVSNRPSTPGSYTWSVPDTIGNFCKIRVRDSNNSNVNDESNNNFAIRGAIQLNTPDLAGIAWTVGTSQNVTWTATGTYPTVEIQYDVDGDFGTTGDTFGILPASTVTNCTPPSTPPYQCNGSAPWTIPDKIGANTKVRVRDAVTVGVNDVSTSAFKILGSFTAISSPAAGAVWNVGDTNRQAQWSANGTITNVKVEYKTSAGASPVTIAANDGSHTSGNNSYTWSAGVADANTEDAYVIVSDANFPEVTMTSAQFRIRPVVTVTAPVGTDQLVVGTNYPNLIKWTKTGTTISTVKLVYSTDGSTFPDPANVIASGVAVGAGTAGVSWSIPAAATLTTTAKVRVIDEGNANVSGDSAAYKLKGGLTLTAPTSGQTWTAASTTNSVNWTFSGGIANVTVKYDPNSGKGADDTPGNADDYPTTIGTKSQSGTSGSSSLTWDMSPVGTNTTTVTNTGRIKIMDAADPTNVYAESADFGIGAAFDITAPENGAIVYADDPYTITWTPVAGTGVSAVKLEYTNNASAGTPTWNTITTSAPNTGNFSWNPVPGTVADLQNDNRVRISQFSPLNGNVMDVGTGTPFAIKPTLDVTTPGLGTESWNVGSTYTIKFKKKGAVQTVDLYYAHDGATWTKINGTPIDVSGAPDGNGEYSYDWTIGGSTTLSAGFAGKIKAKVVTPATQTSVEDVQANSIEVKGSLTLTAPCGSADPCPGVVMFVGSTYNIQWTKTGAITNVDLHYSTNSGGTYPSGQVIVSGLSATATPYVWTVPDSVGNSKRIRVRDSNNNNVWSESNANFTIRGAIQLNIPDLPGIAWTVGSSQNITWTSTGTYPNVDVHYDVDGNFGTTGDTFLIGTVSNCSPVPPAVTCNGSTSWTIPDKIGAATKVRLTSATDANVVDTSTNAFKILGSFTTISNPTAGAVWNVGDTSKQVQWSANGTITNVKLEYKTSAAGSPITIVGSDGGHAAGNNSYTWASGVANANSEDAYIVVSDANFPEVTMTSPAFSIRPTITVTAPTAGQQLVVGTNYSNLIKWTKTGTTITQVKVLYSTDGSTFPDPTNLVADNVPVGDGTAGIDWSILAATTLTNTAKIRVMDKVNANVYGDSPAFKLKGGLVLTSPTAGETWTAGSTTNSISWNFLGGITNAKVYYSLNGTGGPWTLITTKSQTGNSGSSSHVWDMSATGTNTTTVTNTARVKVTDASDEANSVVESSDFNIGAAFNITAPENGAIASAGDPYTITWDVVAGTGVSAVKLEYTNNASAGSPTWNTITTSASNTGNFSWNPVPGSVPDLQNDNRVRISQYSPLNAVVMDTGTGTPFAIKPTLDVTVPGTGSESWSSGGTYTIKLKKKGAVQSVDLYYSQDGTPGNYAKINALPVDVSGAPDGNGEYSYDWTIADATPLTSGFTGKIKAKVVTPATQTSVEDVQANSIEVKGSVTVLTPNTNMTLVVGDTYNITWSKSGQVNNVDLHYSINGGSTYTNPVVGGAALPSVPSTFTWTVPDAIGTNLKIRVKDSNNPNVWDESGAAFSIKGGVTIGAPTGSSVWIAGDPHDITWTRNGSVGLVDLSYNVNDGTWVPIAGGVDSSVATGGCPTAPCYRWTLPTSSIVSSNVKVRITGTDLAAPAISPAFTTKGKIGLTYPDVSGITTSLGDTINVTWNVAGDIGPVKVEYSSDNGGNWATVSTTAPQGGPFGLLLDTPNTTVATTTALVRVSDADDASVTDTSANAFTVKPLIAVTSPANADKWVVGSTHAITWDRKGSNVSNVKIEYSNNNFSSSTVLFGGTTANDGTESWTIPDDIQSVPNLKVKVSTLPTSDPYAVFGVSGGNFQIIGSLEMVQPNDSTGIRWQINTSGNEIKWNATGSVANVKLEYSADSGTNWATIVSSWTSGSGTNKSYPWTIPGNFPIVKDNFRIRVLDRDDTNVYDVATAPSSTLANFTFSAPVAGNIWVAENSNDIQWATPTGGVPATVKLEYTLDGTNWFTVPENDGTVNDGIVTNSGARSWTLGTGLATAAKVRISDPNDAYSTVESAPFKIRGDLTMTAPNLGTESWEVQTNNNITWTKKGDISSVKLQLSTDGGSNYVALVDGTTPTPQDTQNISTAGAGPFTFNWKIPNAAGITTVQAKVRVMDASDSTVYDPSNANFIIKGRVQVDSPNGGETLTVGTSYPITGSVFGPITNVNLFYSIDGLSFPNPVVGCQGVSVVGESFSCNWSVPDVIGTSLKVKVEDAGNSAVNDPSDAVFSVKGTATIVSPVSTSVWYASDTNSITWNRNGTIGNVDLFYQKDGGSWVPIAAGINSPDPTGNIYPWTVPTNNIVSTNVKVRVTGNNLTAPVDSPAFTVKGKITLTYPDSPGIALSLGDTFNVTWTTAGDIGPVMVEYYDGTAWSLVTNSAPQAGPQGITLDAQFTPGNPNGTTAATNGALIRVSDPDDASVTDTSANTFMVKPFLQVTAPSGGEAWVVNSSHTITWNYKGSNVTNVKIEYSKDGGSTFPNVMFGGSTSNDGTESWTIPDDIVAVPNMKIRISSLPLSDPYAVSAVSSGLFKVIGSVTLTQPQAVDKWPVGGIRDIKWSKTGSIANVRLTYSTDGTNYNSVVDSYPGGNGDTGYPWTIPNVAGIVSNTVTVRISDVNDSSVNSVSPQFKIVPSFTVTAPVANERVVVNRPYTITWNSLGQNPTVNIYQSTANPPFSSPGTAIVMGTPNDGSHVWSVPEFTGIAAGPLTAGVRVTYPDDETVYADSPNFKLVSAFTVVSPNSAADKWTVGSSQNVLWTCTSSSVAQATILYSTDGSTYPNLLTTTADNTGAADAQRSWTWNPVPDNITTQFRVKVQATSDSLAADASDFNGKIKAGFTLGTPSASGLNLVVNSSYPITWTFTGTVANVLLDYSKDDFATSTPMNSGLPTANDGLFDWTVPDDITTTSNVKVRIRSSTDNDAVDVSDNAFKIRGDFLVTRPNGGEAYKIGLSDTIQWTTTGNIPTVKVIAYSTNGSDPGFPYTVSSPYVVADPLTNTPNGNKTFTWNPIPNNPSPTIKVRVIDSADATVYDESDTTFRIQGQYTLTSPVGGEKWGVGTTQTITWTWGGNLPNALIEYSTDGGANYMPIQENEGTPNDGIVTNDGSFGWVVPNTIGTTTKIRISDPLDSTVFYVSPGNFKIHGTFTVLVPNTNVRWITNTQQALAWSSTGTMANALIEYSIDGGTNWLPIQENEGTPNDGIVVNDGSFGQWIVPDSQTTTAKIRISHPTDADGRDASDVNFQIDLYQITFNVRDLLSNAHIATVTVTSTSSPAGYAWNASGLNSPIVKGLQAGAWGLQFTNQNYGDQSVTVVADGDKEVTVLMETKVVHVWEAITDLAYSAATDVVSISSTLRRDGITVSGASNCEIKFFEPGNPTEIKSFTAGGPPDANGFYGFVWNAPTGLNPGIVYNVVTKIFLATTGATITTPRTFSIAQEASLQNVKNEVQAKLDTPLSQVKDDVSNAVQTKLDAQTVIVSNKLDAQKSSLEGKLDSQSATLNSQLTTQTSTITTQMAAQSSAIDTKLASFETKTNTQISKIDTSVGDIQNASLDLQKNAAVQEGTSSRFAGKLVMPASVLIGSPNVQIIFLGPREDLIPLISISYRDKSGKEVPIVTDAPMSFDPVQPDTYFYTIKRVEAPPYPAGGVVGVRVLAKDVYVNELIPDRTFDSFVSGSFVVETTTLSTLEGLVAGQAGTKPLVQDTYDAVVALQAEMGTGGHVQQALTNLNFKLDALPKAVSQEGSAKQMRNAINDIATQLKTLAGDNMGYDMTQIVGKALDESSGLKDIRKKADEVQGTTELMQILMERKMGGLEDPVVHLMVE